MNVDVKKFLNVHGQLAENEVKDLLKAFNIKTTVYELVKNPIDLKNIKLKYPVALKVCSRKILHKTDVGGVTLDIKNFDELEKTFTVFKKKFPEEIFLVEQMQEKGVEIIIGLVNDPTFGLSIMFGVGGIFTELYKDVSFRVVPIDEYDAKQMIEEIKGKKLFEGFRGFKANKDIVVELLLKVSRFGESLMDRIDQMDLNPVFVYENSYCVVDAKLILK
ncbi:MAG: acetate--CoA ligase family protein [Candidatus Thermoplasmatota archaeon]|jgi:acyl-CoA synthetase (NDP forming)|nr:acetate--CoA ligase family protein [Candidatus Thermoplasmatota archaeon]